MIIYTDRLLKHVVTLKRGGTFSPVTFISDTWSYTIAANANNKDTTSHLEMRVGDSSAAAGNTKDQDHNKMCHNKLCFRSGDDDPLHKGSYIDGDCITPLTGK